MQKGHKSHMSVHMDSQSLGNAVGFTVTTTMSMWHLPALPPNSLLLQGLSPSERILLCMQLSFESVHLLHISHLVGLLEIQGKDIVSLYLTCAVRLSFSVTSWWRDDQGRQKKLCISLFKVTNYLIVHSNFLYKIF